MIVFYICDPDHGWMICGDAYSGGSFYFFHPSECLMFVPGTYAEMMKDYE